MHIPDLVCPTECEGLQVDVQFDENCAGQGLRIGAFTWAIVVPLDVEVPTTEIDDPASWSDILEDIAIVRGKGSLPEADEETADLYNDPEFVVSKSRNVPFDVTELTDNNYEILQSWECGRRARVYVGTDDFLISLGICPIKVNMSSEGERGSFLTTHLTFYQEGKNIAMPEIFTNVFK